MPLSQVNNEVLTAAASHDKAHQQKPDGSLLLIQVDLQLHTADRE